MTQRKSQSTTDRVTQIITTWAQADLKQAEADALRWTAAELIVAELADGKTQTQLAEEIDKKQSHVSKMANIWKRYGDYSPENRPSWTDAYREVSGKSQPQDPPPNNDPSSQDGSEDSHGNAEQPEDGPGTSGRRYDPAEAERHIRIKISDAYRTLDGNSNPVIRSYVTTLNSRLESAPVSDDTQAAADLAEFLTAHADLLRFIAEQTATA